MKAYKVRRLILAVLIDDKRRHTIYDLIRKLNKRYGANACEQSIHHCLKRLQKEGFIRETGRTNDGYPTYKTI